MSEPGTCRKTEAPEKTEPLDRLLAGATRTIAKVRYCWLVTAPPGGDTTAETTARPMGRLLHDPGEDEWTIRFVTDGRSHKVAGLRRDDRVVLLFQHDPDEAYAVLSGRVRLLEQPAEVACYWKSAYAVYFPTEQDRASAMFLEVAAERLHLWIRGVTPEPFGLTATVLERTADRRWRLAA